MNYESHVIVNHYQCDDKTCLNYSHYCLLHNDIHEVLDFDIINVWLKAMHNGEATLHLTSQFEDNISQSVKEKNLYNLYTLYNYIIFTYVFNDYT
jgi:hypothetical protein